MTPEQAEEVLKGYGYVRGTSTTRDIRGEARAQIKQACRVLEDAGKHAPPFRRPLPVPPSKSTPRANPPKRKGRK